jgi:hypothetical protein
MENVMVLYGKVYGAYGKVYGVSRKSLWCFAEKSMVLNLLKPWKSSIFMLCNQGSNQESNQVFNQAIYQEAKNLTWKSL